MSSQPLPVLYREKMSIVDTAWLRMDSDGNLMMIVSVLMFDKPMNVARLRHTMHDRFLPYQRFRSRVVSDVTGTWWQEQAVDLDDHIIHTQLKSAKPHNKAALECLVSELAATPLNQTKPLWQMHLVDNCIGADGKTRQALVIRIHHCIADGIALVGVLLSMFDQAPDTSKHAPLRPELDHPEENAWMQLLAPITKTTVTAINLSAAMMTKYLWLMADPNTIASRLGEMKNVTSQLALDTIKLLTMTEDSKTRLKGKPSGKKHVAWSEPLQLWEVKAIGKALGCSINDVLMASVAGAVGAYLRAKGDIVPIDSELRAMIPVNLRKSDKDQGDQHELGNAFGLVPLMLPIGIEDPMVRLQEVRRRMDELKGGYQALIAMAVLGILGTTPKQMQCGIQNYFAKKATAVMSNVPGPQAPLYLAGSQLDQIMFWVPQSGDIGMGVSILSYNGGVQFGVVIDDSIAHDPHEIIKCFAPEFEKLVLLVLMSTW